MARAWTILAALLTGVAWAQAPHYTPAGIVQASDYSPGPFAPNSVVTVFGSNLSWYERVLQAGDIVNNSLPTNLGGVEVYIDNWPAPLLYASPGQVNFLIPNNHLPGNVPLRVVRQGWSGPEVTVTLMDAAPSLFADSSGFVLATHGNWPVVTADAPAAAGEIVVVYATGLGISAPNPPPGQIPLTAAYLAAEASLQVTLDGVAVDPSHVKYAGLTPYSAGLYQINLELPGSVGQNPELRVSVAGQSSPAGLRLRVQ